VCVIYEQVKGWWGQRSRGHRQSSMLSPSDSSISQLLGYPLSELRRVILINLKTKQSDFHANHFSCCTYIFRCRNVSHTKLGIIFGNYTLHNIFFPKIWFNRLQSENWNICCDPLTVYLVKVKLKKMSLSNPRIIQSGL